MKRGLFQKRLKYGKIRFRRLYVLTSGGSRKFWWGGILSTTPQNFSDFSAEIGNSNVFFAQNQVVSKKKQKKQKKKGLHRN